ncbi:deoxyribonuclease YcfH [Liquorilactobacillus sucicola DSM 21376 = JCM 15457]|uniref:TatD family deoxyribonuclease n=1 Tax=Liquorilactobacillus sucicola DSM 21376 = JCM 15457 TaxID=1423806 RepID=A0A023D0H4_9LACO|nr:TatD family hydrolase [Liquorilactobacillus sucicola]KRN07196.1 TatD family deoxyribonuclease [Liquorilactobacillus sucicola DSM 21376 = JCM 15457]GAJ27326.1 deoxyribonuclease YcfH [Liquorilactobacillus sucicola DSM 21376 = JCM 15457]
MRIFDSHTHINAPQFAGEVHEVLQRAHALNVEKMLVIAYDEPSMERLQTLMEQYEGTVYGAIGCHPEDARLYNDRLIKSLKINLRRPQMRALGEIGLDYHCEVPHELQKKVFVSQVNLAKKMNLPISVHNRDAFEDVYEILKKIDIRQTGGIMHSFNGNAFWAHKFLELGMFLSFSGVATFRNAVDVREAFMVTPLERVLVETDAPYLTPEPYRGKQNEPGYTRYTLEYLAQVRGITNVELAAASYANSKRILRIK